MKPNIVGSCCLILLIMGVTACASPVTEAEMPTRSPTVLATAADAAVETPVVLTAIVPLTGRSVELGATYPYVDGSVLIAVPAGEFIMGAGGADNPERVVLLRDFWIYSTKVTNWQYAFCEALGQCTSPDLDDNPIYGDNSRANDPVVGVTHDQAVTYCSFVGGRLPTEAEWEKVARGPEGNAYPWGAADPSCDLANFENCIGETTNVVSYPEGTSYYGGLDLAGNVFEWVADWYDSNYYDVSPAENPQGPERGRERSVRSSSYESDADKVAVTNRYSESPMSHHPDIGFRCVVQDPTYFAPFCELAPVYEPDGGDAPKDSCPAIDISQAQYCMREAPVTNVTFSGPSHATIDSNECIPSGDPRLFTCQTPGTVVSVTAGCELDLAGSPSCPSGYSQQASLCVTDGDQGACLTGWEYDSSRQCCSPGSEDNSLAVAPVCPVGTFYSRARQACLPYPVQEVVSVSVEVEFLPAASCKIPSGGRGASDDPAGATLSVATPTSVSGCPPSTM